jgi:hypothetical protein
MFELFVLLLRGAMIIVVIAITVVKVDVVGGLFDRS